MSEAHYDSVIHCIKETSSCRHRDYVVDYKQRFIVFYGIICYSNNRNGQLPTKWFDQQIVKNATIRSPKLTVAFFMSKSR